MHHLELFDYMYKNAGTILKVYQRQFKDLYHFFFIISFHSPVICFNLYYLLHPEKEVTFEMEKLFQITGKAWWLLTAEICSFKPDQMFLSYKYLVLFTGNWQDLWEPSGKDCSHASHCNCFPYLVMKGC